MGPGSLNSFYLLVVLSAGRPATALLAAALTAALLATLAALPRPTATLLPALAAALLTAALLAALAATLLGPTGTALLSSLLLIRIVQCTIAISVLGSFHGLLSFRRIHFGWKTLHP